MTREKVAIYGYGGREHAIGEEIAKSDLVDKIYFIGGNAGTESIDKGVNISNLNSLENIAKFISEHEIGLSVIGPEQPIVDGLADHLDILRCPVFAPSAEAAHLEASKTFAVDFMQKYDIPHPMQLGPQINNYCDSIDALIKLDPEDLVIKVDWLAEGKGVMLPNDINEAKQDLSDIFVNNKYKGPINKKVLFQERLHGPEISTFVVTNGEQFQILPYSQDHKRLLDNDEGPNTGGMGAYAPVPYSILSARQAQKIYSIAEKTLYGLRQQRIPYKGVLYIGLMLAEEYYNDPVVIEYNVRFGNPEAQVLMPLLTYAGVDVYKMFKSIADGNFEDFSLKRNLGKAVITICKAENGYPNKYTSGHIIQGLDKNIENVIVHHDRTKKVDNHIVTDGGRVLHISAMGKNVSEARDIGYKAAELIGFEGNVYRHDIGYQAIVSDHYRL